MNFIYLITGLIIGFVLGWLLKPKEALQAPLENSQEQTTQGYLSESMKQKQKNLEKIRAYIKTRSQVTNNAIEHLLGVSDATVIRYLDELEKEGLIKQIGKTGPSVYYEVK
jgi:Fic family protein